MRSRLKSKPSPACSHRFRPRLEEVEARTVPNAAFTVVENTALVAPAASTEILPGAGGSGEVTLPGAPGSIFSGNSLPAGWQVNPWSTATPGSATVSGGVLTVDGTRVGSPTLAGPSESLVFTATFSGDPYQNIGFGTDFSAGSPFVVFSTGAGGTLYARSSNGSTEQDTNLGASGLGGPHNFEIDWTATGTTFWIDGAVVAQQTLPVTAQLRPLVSDFTVGGGVVTVSSMTLSPPGEAFVFSGPGLPAGWSVTSNTPYSNATVGSGQLTVDGEAVGTQAFFTPGRAMNFEATFTGDPYQNIGFGTDFLGTTPYAIFSTGPGGALYARTNDGTTAEDVLLPSDLLNTEHDFEIDWTATGVTFYVDGTQVDSEAGAPTVALRALVSDFNVGGGVLTVDSMEISPPYNASGTFLSQVFDAGAGTSSLTGTWNATTPTGTGVAVSVRMGNTPTPDATWTAFTPLTGTVTGSFQYFQYEANLTTTDLTVAPVLNSVTVTAGGNSFTDSTLADFEAGTAGTGLLATAPNDLGTLLTADLVYAPADGTLALAPDGSFTYTPDANFVGTDSFVYADMAANGAVSAQMTVTLNVYAPPNLTASGASGTEGNPIPLAISASPSVTDGSETLSVTIGGLPPGATLSAGTVSNGVWTLTPAQLSGLSVTIPDGGTFDLSVTATALVTATGATVSTSAALPVTVTDPAPTAVLAQVGTATYGQNAVAGFTGAADPSAADTAAGFHYAFATSAGALASATYANSSASPTASFGQLGAGTYTVYGEVIDQYGGFTQDSTTITVSQASATVTVNGYTGTYDGLAHGLTGTATGVLGENLSSLLQLGGTQTAAGSTSVNWSFAGNANYLATSGSATISIAPATLTVTAGNASKVYGAANPTLTDTITGFVPGDGPSVISGSPALSTTATASSPVGAYPITPSVGTLAAANYTFAFVKGTLTVTPATPTVAVTDAGGPYTGSAFPATATVTGVSGSPASSLEGVTPTLTYYVGSTASGTGSTAAPSAAGTYTVVASFPGSTDFSSANKTATFTITASGSISGTVYLDVSGNGLNTSAAPFSPADTPIGSGVTVYLDLNNDGRLDTGDPTTVTAANGTYTFTGLAPGAYHVAEVVPGDDVLTAPTTGTSYLVTLAAGRK